MADPAVSAFFTGFKQGATVLDEIREKKVDVDKKALDLKNAQDTARRMQHWTDEMEKLHADPNKSPVDNVTEMAEKASVAALGEGLTQQAHTMATIAASVSQSDTYAKSIQLQQHKQTLSELSAGVGTVKDEASWQEFAQTFEKTHPPQNEFGSMGIFRDSNGKLYPYSPERVAAIQRGSMTAGQQVTVDLNKLKIKSEEIRQRQTEATIRLTEERIKAVKAKEDAVNKAGGAKVIPGDVTMVYNLAVEAGYDKDYPGAREALRAVSTEVAEQIPAYVRQGMTRSQAAKKAYNDATNNKDNKFAGMPTVIESMKIKGTWDQPRTMPVDPKTGAPDTSKLKPNSYVQGTGTYKGAVLYWDGKKFSLPQVEQPAGGEGDDTGDDTGDDE